MSRSIDEKIVKMSMDNSDLQSKANQTVGIFARLTSAFTKTKNVNLDKSVKSVNDLNNAASKNSMEKLAAGVSNVSSKFTALGVVAITALTNITNRAVNAGLQMAKSFTVKPITDGFGEYELKMKSIQTILSNTQGKSSLEDVTGTLDELNTYADKTIYNFAEMTRNIGTFTAAGVGLKDSATAIKGIANLAAASGSSSEQASTAMYQLSQALATGSVKLQDWNSVVNAGMGGKLFQNALIKTADSMGIANTASKNFRDSLQEGWLTSEVLLKTLDQFSKDQSMLEAATKVRTFTQLVDTAGEALGSGWAQTWEIILGDFEEAGKMWSAANDAISVPIEKGAKARNELIQGFVDLGGRTAIVNTIANAFKGLMSVITTVKNAFHNVFPPATAEGLFKMAQGLEEFSKKLVPSAETTEKLGRIFTGLFSILGIGVEVVKMVANAIVAMIPDGAGGSVLDFIVKIADMITNLHQTIKASDKAQGTFKDLHEVVNGMADGFKKAASFIQELFSNTGAALTKVANVLTPIVRAIVDSLTEFFSSFTMNDVINGGLIATLAIAIKKFSGLGDKLKEMFSGLGEVFEKFKGSFDIFEQLGDALSTLTGAVKANIVLQIAVAVGVLAGSLKLLSTIDVQDLSKGLFAIATIMFMLTKSLGGIANATGGISNAIQAAVVLPALAGAILALSVGLKIIASMDIEELGRGMLGLVGIVTTLVTAIGVLSKLQGKINTGALTMVALATSVVILASGVKMLSDIKTEGLVKGVATIGAIFAELAIFMKIVNGSRINPGSAVAVTIISGAILVMVEGIRQIANIDTNSIVKGLVTIGAILTEIAVFVRLTSGTHVMSAATGMLIVAGAINALVGPIGQLGNMSLETLAKGLGAMAIALGEVVIAMKVATGSMSGATSILIVAGAVNALVPPLKILGSMSVEQIAKALIALAGAFTIIAVAANAIGVVGSVGLLAFAAGVTAVGFAATAVAAAITAFTTALTVLSAMTGPAIANVIATLSTLVTGVTALIPQLVQMGVTIVISMANGLSQAIPTLAARGLEMIVSLLGVLAENIPQVVSKGADIIIGFAQAMTEKGPELIQAGIDLIISLTNGMANGIRDNSEEIIQAAMNLVEAILEIVIDGLEAVVSAMFGWIPGFEDAADGLGTSAKEALRDAFNTEKGKQIGDDASSGYVEGVNGKSGDAKAAGKNVGENAKAGAGSVDPTSTGKASGAAFTSGVASQVNNARSAGTNLANSSKNGANGVQWRGTGSASGSQFNSGVASQNGNARTVGWNLGIASKNGLGQVTANDSGRNLGEGFAQGIESKQNRVSNAGSWLANVGKSALEAFLKIFSPSRVMRKDGGFFGEGFALGIEDQGKNVEKRATSLGSTAKNAVAQAANGLTTRILDNIELTPTITPVLDTSNMRFGDLNSAIALSSDAFRTQNIPDPRNSQNGDKAPIENHFDIKVEAHGDVSRSTIRKLTEDIQDEMKNMADRIRSSQGEEVYF